MSLASTSPKKIHLVGDGRYEEAIAAGAIMPGHLVKLDSDGKVAVHGSAAGVAERMFAVEDALQGNSIDDAYAADDRVALVIARPGDVIYAWLDAGADGTVAVGDPLTSSGNGLLKKGVATNIVAIALQALDLNDTGDVDTRIKVRVI